MADPEVEQIEEKDFAVEIAKQGRATCEKCKETCPKNEIRLAKLVYNPSTSGKMKSWHHVQCLFETFVKQRPTTKRIQAAEDIDGFDLLSTSHQQELMKRIEKSNQDISEKYGTQFSCSTDKKKLGKKVNSAENSTSPSAHKSVVRKEVVKHYPFRDFRKLVAKITKVSSYPEKTQIVSEFFIRGLSRKEFEGDIYLWCKMLLPGVMKRIYNLQSEQLVKIFSRIFKIDMHKMLQHLEQGDVDETLRQFYKVNTTIKPAEKSNLSVEEVDVFLEELSKLTKEEEQEAHFLSILNKCTSNDLKIIIRLIKHDLKMNAGAKHILDGVHKDAYEAYQSSRDLKAVIEQCLSSKGEPLNLTEKVSAYICVMTPVLPMLAESCKSVEKAMKKCINGMYAEIKYDGERIQVHKKGSDFKFFSRSLKPVGKHKIAHFKNYIPIAFPKGDDLILDSELLMIDIETQAPLPFDSLRKHKKDEYQNACVCLFVFDCIFYNGKDLTKKPIEYRKKILNENMIEVKNHIVFSESKVIHEPADLREMMIKVFELGLEGLVLKDLKSIYEPGKRHWLKVKKHYLFDGAMADSADLIVLGAWYGTGKKGGKMSVFLMGCYDERREKFCTVTKVHTGIDDKTLEELQEQLEMTEINCMPNLVPDWLLCNRAMVPDFVAKTPTSQPVWEITGVEFTRHEIHTANGISVRLPRVTKMRNDKNWKTATSLQELKRLFEISKGNSDSFLLMKDSESHTANKASSLSMSIEELYDYEKIVDKSDAVLYSHPIDDSPNRKRKYIEIPSPRRGEIFYMMIPEGSDDLDSSGRSILNVTFGNIEDDMEEKEEQGESFYCKKKIEDSTVHAPLYFRGVELFLEKEVETLFENYSEQFSSFGGKLLKQNERNDATHVLHKNRFVQDIGKLYPYNAHHIVINWIEESIKNNGLQDVQPYIVKWRIDL